MMQITRNHIIWLILTQNLTVEKAVTVMFKTVKSCQIPFEEKDMRTTQSSTGQHVFHALDAETDWHSRKMAIENESDLPLSKQNLKTPHQKQKAFITIVL